MAPDADTLPITGDPEADHLLATEPLALVIGTLLNEQMPMERAFRGPLILTERLGEPLDAHQLAGAEPDQLAALFAAAPPVHRGAARMAARTQELCRYLVEHHGGDAGAVWEGAATGDDLLARIQALPGFDPHKARLLISLLAERLHVALPGWEPLLAGYSDREWFSVAPKPRRWIGS